MISAMHLYGSFGSFSTDAANHAARFMSASLQKRHNFIEAAKRREVPSTDLRVFD